MGYYTILYTYFILPFAGKTNNIGSKEAFKVSVTDENTKYLVAETSKYIKLKGSKILMNRYFLSVSVAI